jgi:predicted nuclease of restriction endonuclease-like (RecB) superfamily
MPIEEPRKRSFYEQASIQGHWSVRQLDREINALLYERTALSKRKELVLAKANKNAIVTKPEDEIKDSYVLDFVGLKNEYSESDLEDALIRHLENFLLELGRGFTFVARQKKFVLDGDEYRIDLLLFNISLNAYIVLELKLTKFTHSHAGQTNFYVNWVKDNVSPRAENDPIGIILCSNKNNTTVKYATGGLNNKIFVSKYLLELPKPEELQRELERGRELFLQNQSSRESNPDQIEKTRGNQEKQ